MDQKLIHSISRNIGGKFPEVAGKKPIVKQRPGAKSTPMDETYLLVYKGKAISPTGKTIPRQIRVVADKKGKILKITTSR